MDPSTRVEELTKKQMGKKRQLRKRLMGREGYFPIFICNKVRYS